MKTTIPALILAAAACASFTALAATAAEPAKAAEVQADKADARKVQPHSHLQEKTGIMPQKKAAKAKPEEEKSETPAATGDQAAVSAEPKAPGAKRAKVKADKDKTKHFHPRDGK